MKKHEILIIKITLIHNLYRLGFSIAAENVRRTSSIKLLRKYAEQIDNSKKSWSVSQLENWRDFMSNFNLGPEKK